MNSKEYKRSIYEMLEKIEDLKGLRVIYILVQKYFLRKGASI